MASKARFQLPKAARALTWGSRALSEMAQASRRGVVTAILLALLVTVGGFSIANLFLGAAIVAALQPPSWGETVSCEPLILDKRGAPDNRRPDTDAGAGLCISVLAQKGSPMPGWRYSDGEERGGKTSDTKYAHQYQVFKGQKPVMYIEARMESRGSADALVLDLAMIGPNGDPLRIPWWEIHDISKSNAALVSSPHWYAFRSVEYPTNPSALMDWVRTRWIPTTKKLNPAYGETGDAASGKVALGIKKSVLEGELYAQLLRRINHDLNGVQYAAPVVTTRVINGVVQVLTLWAFATVTLILGARWLLFVHTESEQDDGLTAFIHKHLQQQRRQPPQLDRAQVLDEIAQREDRYALRWGCRASPTLEIWRGTLMALTQGWGSREVPSLLESFARLEEERLASMAGIPRFLISALPALGFIGTVIGIPQGLLGISAGGAISDDPARQNSGISGVGLDLAYAFDTTLLALILALIAQWVFSVVNAGEEHVLQSVRRSVLSTLLRTIPDPAMPSERSQAVPARSPAPAPAPRPADPRREPHTAQPSPAPTSDALYDPRPFISQSQRRGPSMSLPWLLAGSATTAAVIFGIVLFASRSVG